MQPRIQWPDGKDFAFTIFDDTDRSTLENTPPVYELLTDLGFRTTKSVWPLRGDKDPVNVGLTCEDREYLAWVKDLQQHGFEIGLHNVTYHTSTREETRRGIERFRELFGQYPSAMANHVGCFESIYWGNARLTGVNRFIYNLLTGFKNADAFQGHLEGSPLFWGDLCKDLIKYVRNFVLAEINTLKACPFMPYHDQSRPYVNYWFASSEGPEVNAFVRTISEANQDRLEREGGACIMYTHLANGFYRDGRMHPRFNALMKRLSRKNGWFVPVTTLLDYLLKVNGPSVITTRERSALERKWLIHKVRAGGTT